MNVRNVPNSRLMATPKKRAPKHPHCAATVYEPTNNPLARPILRLDSAPLDRPGAASDKTTPVAGRLRRKEDPRVSIISASEVVAAISFDTGQFAEDLKRSGSSAPGHFLAFLICCLSGFRPALFGRSTNGPRLSARNGTA